MVKIAFDRHPCGKGSFALLFTPPRLDAFLDRGWTGSGHDWERLLVHWLARLAPDALAGTVFDCEADLFVAIHPDPRRLDALEVAITEMMADERSLCACIMALEAED